MNRHAPPLVARLVAGSARFAHVAVETAAGPHVTPQGFAWVGDDLWLVAARGSLKVRAIRRRPRVGVLLRSGNRAAVLSGVAEVLWPGDARAARRVASALPALPCATAAYGFRNAALLAGYVADLLDRSAPLPLDRVAIRVRVRRGVLLDGDDVQARWGDWNATGAASRPAAGRGRSLARVLDGVPGAAAALGRRNGDAVLGVETPFGPVPAPARWDARTRRATVAADIAAAFEVPRRARAALEIDQPSYRPSRVAGVMLGGAVTFAATRGRRIPATVEPERATWWLGFEAGTTASEAVSPAA